MSRPGDTVAHLLPVEVPAVHTNHGRHISIMVDLSPSLVHLLTDLTGKFSLAAARTTCDANDIAGRFFTVELFQEMLSVIDDSRLHDDRRLAVSKTSKMDGSMIIMTTSMKA